MNKIDKAVDNTAELTASLILAPFKFAERVFDRVFWWV